MLSSTNGRWMLPSVIGGLGTVGFRNRPRRVDAMRRSIYMKRSAEFVNVNEKADREGLVCIELARQSRAGTIEIRWSARPRGVSVSACNGRVLIQAGDAMLALPAPIAEGLRRGLARALRAREVVGE